MLLDKRPPFKYLLSKVKMELVYVSVTALVVYYITTAFKYVIPDMPLPIPAFLGTAISVVLSFKLSQSYERWWEARKIWGSIVNDSRNFIIQLKTFLDNKHESTVKQLAFRQIAWSYSLGQTLRGLNPMDNVGQYLSNEDLQRLDKHTNKPLAILQLNAEALRKLREEGVLELFSLVQLNTTIVNLTNSMGMAERIKSTVFPVTYRIFLHAIIYIFVITLSISLRNIAGYFEIPLLLIISIFFFLLERTATHLQDPFSNKPTDTAMTAIATTIEINIKQMLEEEDVPEPHQPNGFYLC